MTGDGDADVTPYNRNWVFKGQSGVDCSGNLVSLCYYGAATMISWRKFQFAYLFADQTLLKKPPRIAICPIGDSCFEAMFINSGIIETPCINYVQYPAGHDVHPYAFFAMFEGCKSLESVPRFPYFLIGPSGDQPYRRTFKGCTKLKFSTSSSAQYPNLAFGTGMDSGGFSYGDDCFKDTSGSYTGALKIANLGESEIRYYTSNRVVIPL